MPYSDDSNPTLMNARLRAFQEKKTDLNIYLQNGIRLTGSVVDFDEHTLEITSSRSASVLIQRNSIATVQRFTPGEVSSNSGGSQGYRSNSR